MHSFVEKNRHQVSKSFESCSDSESIENERTLEINFAETTFNSSADHPALSLSPETP